MPDTPTTDARQHNEPQVPNPTPAGILSPQSIGRDSAQPPQAGEQPQGETPYVPESYEEWLALQDAATIAVVKPLVESHIAGLKSALESERGNRKDLEKQLRELAAAAETGSEAAQKLTQLADEAQQASRRAAFYEQAHGAGITNLKLAFLVAVQDEMFDRRGEVDFDRLKAAYPELYRSEKPAVPPGHGGEGTQNPPPASRSMNDMLRAMAGV